MVASNDPSSNEIEKCISNCLKTASEQECESISFPAVGAGSSKLDPEKAATAILHPSYVFGIKSWITQACPDCSSRMLTKSQRFKHG